MAQILILGDIVGKPGRRVVAEALGGLRERLKPDFIIANGENASGGAGIEPKTADEIFAAGVHVITTGNHIWQKREIIPYLNSQPHKILRPLNFPPGTPGKGFLLWTLPSGDKVAVVNLMGRVFMPMNLDCPFRAMDSLLKNELLGVKNIIVDFHAEATSEKVAMGYHLDGRVSLVFGTHTHVQTADNRLLPKGTGFISDIGMCGPYDSVIGVTSEGVIGRFMTGQPVRFEVAKGRTCVHGININLDTATGRVNSIDRVLEVYE